MIIHAECKGKLLVLKNMYRIPNETLSGSRGDRQAIAAYDSNLSQHRPTKLGAGALGPLHIDNPKTIYLQHKLALSTIIIELAADIAGLKYKFRAPG